LRAPEVIVIPKAAHQAHLRSNRDAAELRLATADLDALDAGFPPPSGPVPLALL
jgi:diketogulonate reductase-like aldo/keto reductase